MGSLPKHVGIGWYSERTRRRRNEAREHDGRAHGRDCFHVSSAALVENVAIAGTSYYIAS